MIQRVGKVLAFVGLLSLSVLAGCSSPTSSKKDTAPTYSVTYDKNNSDPGGVTGSVTDTHKYHEGDHVTIKGTEGLTYSTSDYSFGGWCTAANGDYYNEGDQYTMGNQNITLYAIWNQGSGPD